MKYPFISIIIPTKNEEKHIGKLLTSLFLQSYPKSKFEVLIFDGLSKDKTLEIIKNYRDKLNIKIFKNLKIKQVYAFNEGIKRGKGNYFIILGAHADISKKFVENSVKTFLKIKKEEPKLAGVGGTIKNKYKNKFSKLISLLYSSPFSGASSYRYNKKPHFSKTIVFGLYDKNIVKKIGKFDEDFIVGQDLELNLRLNKKGYKLYTNPKIKAYYFPRLSFKKFLKQTFNYGAARGLLIRKKYFCIFWFIPAFFVLYELFLIFFNSFVAFLPLISYFIISFFVSVKIFMNTKKTESLILPFFYFLFHNLIGFGFIYGLIRGKKCFRK